MKPSLRALMAEAGPAGSRAAPPYVARFDALADDFQAWLYRVADVDGVEEDEIRRWARRKRLDYLGAGNERAVFAVPEGALKLAFDPDDKGSNRAELRVWEEAPPRIRRYLVPVLDASPDGRWLLMEYVVSTGKGTLPFGGYRDLDGCGIADLTSHNLSDDGRVLDYAFLFDGGAWERCAGEVR